MRNDRPLAANMHRPAGGRWGRARGFTLIEMLVVITITAILLAVAAPSFVNVSLSSKLSATANRLSASAVLARGEAIKRNTQVTLCKSVNGTSCITTGGWEQGWIVTVGTNVLLYEQAAPLGYKVTETGGVSTLTFQPTGVGTTQGDFTVCRATPSVGDQERHVAVNATGRTLVEKKTTGVCS